MGFSGYPVLILLLKDPWKPGQDNLDGASFLFTLRGQILAEYGFLFNDRKLDSC